ncbi:hypothetical protein GWE18_23885 [Bradyrhizobium sp. CSA112]|uniref:hypothetical protein n=1 Tax=Bradyrhizobium sp. CSA112 TaxID=2699170 RepID=UPI0023AF8992|nr:hypothetical protein [Bradyrhizobium sp. CSA112]MDE5455821.1 hypothetical protein [Bradyrhizobium sp. CSA112]
MLELFIAIAARSIVFRRNCSVCALAPRLGACQFAIRLKNNLLPFTEIGFVSLCASCRQSNKETRT